jgi:hypothetical protein
MGQSNSSVKALQLTKAEQQKKKQFEEDKKAEVAALFSSSMVKQQVCMDEANLFSLESTFRS